MDLTPTDFLSGLGGIPNLPHPYEDQQQVTQDQQQNQAGKQQLALGALKLGAIQQQQQEAQQYQTDVANALKTGDFAGLYAKYPDQQKALQAAHDELDEPARRVQERDLFAVSSYIKNGSIDAAKSLLQKRIDADKAAGRDASDDQQMFDALNSGDPNQVKAAADMALYAILPPDKRAEVFTKSGQNEQYTLAPGSKRYDALGNLIAEAPFAPEYRNVGAGDSLVKLGGGDPASSGGPASGRTQGGWTPRQRNGGDNPDAAVDNKIVGVAQALGVDPDADIRSLSPAQIARALSFGEGGAGTLADRNNNPTNLRNGDGSYKQFKSPDAAYTAAAALVARKLKNGQTSVRTLIEGLPVGGGSGGGAQVVAQGAPKPGYTMLTPQEKASIPGLDPNTVYQRAPDGQITAVGGQSRSQLKPWPQQALTGRAANTSSLSQIDQALSLLDPKNKSREAQMARYGIGPTNSVIPSAVLQQTNPAGNSIRSLLGQVGGIIVHDISGAAVGVMEDQRLSKWVPRDTDTPQAAIAKLRQLRNNLVQKNTAMDEAFSEDQGYRPFHATGAAATGPAVQVKSAADWAKLAKGTPYVDPKGVRRVKS